MTGGQISLIVGLAIAVAFAAWAWQRFDINCLPVTYDSGPPEAPGWTEETVGEDGLSYGRSGGGYHTRPDDMERRARRGEFDTPV